jgi:hypothetical protein
MKNCRRIEVARDQSGLGVPSWMKNSFLHAEQVRCATRIFGMGEKIVIFAPQYGQTIGCW